MQARPVGVMPPGLTQIAVEYDILAGELDAAAELAGGATYVLKVLDRVTDLVIIPEFEVGVPDEAGAVDFWDLYASVNVPIDNPYNLNVYQLRSEKAQASGYASLGVDGKVPAGQLPAAAGGSGTVTSVNAILPDGAGDVTLTPADIAAADAAATAAALALKADLVGGLIPTAQLPALAINKIDTVASEIAMLALVSERGDMAIRSDTDRVYALATDDPSQLVNWVLLPVPAAAVLSVNSQSGVVVLDAADVGAAPASTVADIAAAVADIAGHETRIDDAEADIVIAEADIATAEAGLTNHEARIAALEGAAGGAGADELEHFRIEAALLEPFIYRTYYGYEIVDVPTLETWFHQVSWNLRVMGTLNAIARWENRDISTGPIPLRGITLTGQDIGSMGVYANPTGIVYADPKGEYYRKLGILRGLTTRYRRIANETAGTATDTLLTWESSLPGPHGSVIFQAMVFDRSWGMWQEELGDWAASVGKPHQEVRFTDGMMTPFTLNSFPKMGSGEGYDWGGGNGVATKPVSALMYVNVPLDYLGPNNLDPLAPEGYLHGVSTVGGLPGNLTQTDSGAGSIGVHEKYEWLAPLSSGTDYDTGWRCNDTFDPLAGRSVILDYHHESNTHKALIGVGSGTGIGLTDFTHAIHIDAGTIKVRHDAGAGIVSRSYGGWGLQVGNTYRFQITFDAGGRAWYRMQTTYAGASTTEHPIGSTNWYDLLEGTRTATGAGFIGSALRLKGSVGGTAGTGHLLAWPRVAEAHAGAVTAPVRLLEETFGVPRVTLAGWTATAAYGLNGKQPFPIQPKTFGLWSTTSAEWRYRDSLTTGEPRSAHNLSSSTGQIHLKLLLGVADIDYTVKFNFQAVGSGGFFGIGFNYTSDGATGWSVKIRPSDGFACTWEPDGTPTDQQILGALSAGDIWFRARTVGDLVQTWVKIGAGAWVQLSNRSPAGRAQKTETLISIIPPDENASYVYGGVDGPKVDAAFA